VPLLKERGRGPSKHGQSKPHGPNKTNGAKLTLDRLKNVKSKEEKEIEHFLDIQEQG
jgi:hypothetical protein